MADPAGLGGADDLTRGAAGDGEDVPVQVIDLQGGQLAAPGTGVGGEPGQEQDLLGTVQPPPSDTCAIYAGLGDPHLALGVLQEGSHGRHRCVQAHSGLGWAAHPVQR